MSEIIQWISPENSGATGAKSIAKRSFELFLSTYLQIHQDQWYT